MAARIIVWRISLVVAALGLGWLIIVNGVTGYYSDRLAAGDESAIEHIVTWDPNNARALLRQGQELLKEDPQAAVGLLERSYRAKPTEPAPLMVMAGYYLEEGNTERSDALMEFAGKLDPADPEVQRALANYWAVRDNPAKALEHWSNVLLADRAAREDLFPLLLKILEQPQLRAEFARFAATPLPWWNDFFRYSAGRSLDLETVRYVAGLRRQSLDSPLTDEERDAFVARLLKEGLVSEAYLVWVSGLDSVERGHLGLLFNGGFELPITGAGFDWHIAPGKHFSAHPAATYGARDSKALRLEFRMFEGPFWRLSQPLFLDSGNYRMSGRARADSLASKGGLKWQVVCKLPQTLVLGEGPRFLGSGDWQDFDFEFSVPPGCTFQQLRLVSAGTREFERKLSGVLWFDDLQMLRIRELDTASIAAELVRQQSSGNSSGMSSADNSDAPEPGKTSSDEGAARTP